MDATPVWMAFEDRLAGAYRAFAEAEFGRNCYQAAPGYTEWLYRENNHSRGYRDFSVGVAGGAVIGCIHKMYLPWTIGGQLCSVPTLHNLMVAPAYRSGVGFWLLKRSLHQEEHAVIPSTKPPLADVYRRMQCQAAPTRWLRKAVRPMAGAARLALNRIMSRPHAAVKGLQTNEVICGCRVSTRPDPEMLALFAKELQTAEGPDHVLWTPDLVKWRFFHPLGAMHGYAELGSPSEFAVFSLGPRDGLTVGRLIFVSRAASTESGIKRICEILRTAGAHVILAMTACDPVFDALLARHFRPYPFALETYLFHRDRNFVQNTVVGSEITDIGFEALPFVSADAAGVAVT